MSQVKAKENEMKAEKAEARQVRASLPIRPQPSGTAPQC